MNTHAISVRNVLEQLKIRVTETGGAHKCIKKLKTKTHKMKKAILKKKY